MNTAESSKSNNPLKWLLAPIAVPSVLLYKLGKKLSGEAYKGFARGLVNGLIGFALAGLVAFLTAIFVGWTHEYTVLLWFPASCLAWLGTMFIAWPAAFLYIVDPLYDVLHKFLNWTDKIAKEQGKPFFEGLINLVSILPGSGALWNFVNDKNVEDGKPRKGVWVKGLVGGIAALGAIALAGASGYCAYLFVAPLIPATLAWGYGTIAIAGLAAFLAFWIPVRILYQLLDHAELNFAAPALTAAATYAGAGYIAAGVASLGLAPVFVWPALALTFIVGIAYIYPGFHALLKSGLVKAILDGIKNLVEMAYDDDDADYRKFFGHVVTIPASLAVGALAFIALAFYGIIPAAVGYAVAAVVALVSYLGFGEVLKDRQGSVLVGLVSSAAVGVTAYFAPHAAIPGWAFWTGLVVLVVATFLVAYPAVYGIIRLLTRSWLAKPAGGALDSIHNGATKVADRVQSWWDKKVIDRSYDDNSEYRDFFMHATNAAVLGLGIWQALPLFTAWVALPAWAIIAILAVLGFIVYMILGRILLGTGPIAFGFAVSAALFGHTAYNLYLLAPEKWWLAGLIGITAASVCFTVVAPAVMAIVRVPANILLRPWLKPVLVELRLAPGLDPGLHRDDSLLEQDLARMTVLVAGLADHLVTLAGRDVAVGDQHLDRVPVAPLLRGLALAVRVGDEERVDRAEADMRLGLDLDLLVGRQAIPVQEGAVRAAHVLEVEALLGEGDRRVRTRDRLVLDRELDGFALAADDEVDLVDVLDLPDRLVGDDQTRTRRLEGREHRELGGPAALQVEHLRGHRLVVITRVAGGHDHQLGLADLEDDAAGERLVIAAAERPGIGAEHVRAVRAAEILEDELPVLVDHMGVTPRGLRVVERHRVLGTTSQTQPDRDRDLLDRIPGTRDAKREVRHGDSWLLRRRSGRVPQAAPVRERNSSTAGTSGTPPEYRLAPRL